MRKNFFKNNKRYSPQGRALDPIRYLLRRCRSEAEPRGIKLFVSCIPLGSTRNFVSRTSLASFGNKGFTLIELIIVVAIVAIISGISFSSLAQSTDNFGLKKAVRSTADLYRQAQNYATNIRENPDTSDDFLGKFGVYINEANPAEVIFYADTESAETDRRYDGGVGCSDECESRLLFNGGIRVSDIIVTKSNDTKEYPQVLDVLFVRPHLSPVINVDVDLEGMDAKEVEVIFENRSGHTESVIIGATGYIFSN